MKRVTFSLKYMLLTCRLDMLWLPAAFLALFIILAWMLRNEPSGYTVTTSYFGVALPLIAGVLAAYAVLEDPALELHFASPRPTWWMLVERMGAILVLSTACGLIYQAAAAGLGYDLSPIGSFVTRQFVWLVPVLAMTGLGAAVAFAGRSSAAGSAAVGMVWIFQILLRGWFLQDRIACYLLLPMGSLAPDHPALRGNQTALTGLAVVLLAAGWAMLRRQERYL